MTPRSPRPLAPRPLAAGRRRLAGGGALLLAASAVAGWAGGCAQSDAIEPATAAAGGPSGGGGEGGPGGPGSGGAGGAGAGGGSSTGGPSTTSSTGTDAGATGTGGSTSTSVSSSASGGPVCGDGLAEGEEACDGDDLRGETCVTQGFAGGELGCADCELATSGCTEAPGCENGIDDDGDGLVDAADPACTGAGDDDELVFAPNCDGAGAPVVDLTHAPGLPISISGTTVGLGNAFTATGTASCPTTPDGEVAFRLVVSQVSDLLISLDNPGTGANWDPVLYVRSSSCVGTQVGCNDDANGTLKSELVLADLPAGTYFVFVDAAASEGDFELTIEPL